MKQGGCLFYIGVGISGWLGILDVFECLFIYGVLFDWVIGLIVGGDYVICNVVEFVEDSEIQAWKDLEEYFVNDQDMVIGIVALGIIFYVVYGFKECQKYGILIGCIICNLDVLVSVYVDYLLEVIVGLEFVMGSMCMKVGIV